MGWAAAGRATGALLLLCLALGGTPPPNDDLDRAEWVHTLIRLRGNGSLAAVRGAYPGGTAAAPRAYDFVNFTGNGSNTRATMQVSEPSHGTHSWGVEDSDAAYGVGAYRPARKSLWWKWTSPVNATVRVSTLGSTFDTTLGIYTRVPWDGVTVSNEFGVKEVGRGDDILWNKILQSEADITVHAGETYYIAVAGYKGASGVVKLSGHVESWIYPPVRVGRVATPRFELDLFGVPQDSGQGIHNKFVNITITCATPGAQIFYTTDGLMPNVLPTMTQGFRPQETTRRFTAPLRMDTFTIRVVAYKAGLRRSLLATSTDFQLQAEAPVIAPDGGEFEVAKEVRILGTTDADSDPRAVIHYTLDGSEPELTSPLYAGGVVLRNVSNVTIKARVWYPSEWREDGRQPSTSSYVLGMLPSNVTVSRPFTVKPRLPLPAMPVVSGETDPMVLKGGNPPIPDKSYIGAATISLSIDNPRAEIWYAFAPSVGAIASWSYYNSTFSVEEVGMHWIHVQGRCAGYTDSNILSDHVEVLERIRIIEANTPFLETVDPGTYKYYTLNLTKVGTDVTVTITKFFGSVDIFLSARQRRPSLHNHSLSATSMTIEGGQGGLRLLGLHTDDHLGIQVIAERNSSCPLCPYSTPIVVGVHGTGITPTQMVVRVALDYSPVIRLSQMYHGAVDIGTWKYFKLYLGSGPEVTRRGLVVRAWQSPPSFVGIRVAIRQTNKPTNDLSGTPYTMFASNDGYYEFTIPDIGTASREPWFVGIEGLVPINGAEALNFTFAVSPMVDDDPVPFPGQSMIVGERSPAGDMEQTARTVNVVEIFDGVGVQGSVEIGRFAFFRLRTLLGMRTLELRVTEKYQYSGGLRIYVQQGAPPSLISHIKSNVETSSTVDVGQEGYFYAIPVVGGKDYYIGVYGFSYDFQSDMRVPMYRFTITAKTVVRFTPAQEAILIRTIQTNYQFQPGPIVEAEYTYYRVDLSDVTRDLHIITKSAYVDIVVSNTNPFPTLSLIDVGWKSVNGGVFGPKRVNIHTFDPGFRAGPYYVGVFSYVRYEFEIASFVDQSSFVLEAGKSYRMRVTSRSYRYFRFLIDKMYDKLTIVFREETSGVFMTALVMKGEKPTDATHLFRSETPDADGNIVYALDKPELDWYFLMVQWYKRGYSGPVLQHSYIVEIKVDFFEPPGYKALEHETEFQAIRDKRYEQAGIALPPPWEVIRPSLAWKIPTLEIGRPQTAAFFGEPWHYFSVYVSAFSSNLTITARPMTNGLSFTLVIRRALKPTLVTFIDKVDTPDENGDYIVRAANPVTGGFYYVGVYGSVLDLKEAKFVILASVDPGIPVLPTYKTLINYFVAFDTVPALNYKFYKIYLPADERDLSIQVTHLVGLTDIVISNVNPWPTKSNYNASQSGWWKTEAAVGGGKEIVVRNYERGYKSPAWYYIGVFSVSFSSYFVLARLDRPPATVPIGSVFTGQVAESAFATFRFPVNGLIQSRLIFIVSQRRPYSTGLTVYGKRDKVPTLIEYDVKTQISTANGEYFLNLDQPRPDDIFYLGVYGSSSGVLPRGTNYYFLAQMRTQDEFKLYVSEPYLLPPPKVPPRGNYVAPSSSSYTILVPETPLKLRLFNNGSIQFFRLQVSEFTSVTAIADPLPSGAAHHRYGPLFVVARRLHLPERNEPPYNSSHVDWFSADVCSQLADTSEDTRCYPSTSPSILLSPFDNFVNSSMWYVGVYAVGCRALLTCALWGAEPNSRAGKDCGCDPAKVEAVPFTLTATRVPRLGLYGSLQVGHNNVILESPYDLHKFFLVEINGSAAVHFQTSLQGPRNKTSGRTDIYDVFMSDEIPYPQRTSLPPPSLRSEAIFGNPPVTITVLKPEENTTYVKVGVHSSESATISVVISLTLPYYPVVLGRSYAGLLRVDSFSSEAQKRVLFVLDSETHQGRRLVLRLRPVNVQCPQTQSEISNACGSSSCCGGRNPFGGFSMAIRAENGFGSDWEYAQSEPNIQCIISGLCPNHADTSSVCCLEYRMYQIVFDAQLAPRWLISVTGDDDHPTQGPRFTDSFVLDVKLAGVSDTPSGTSDGNVVHKDGDGPVAGEVGDEVSMSDNALGATTPLGRYVFQSASLQGPRASSVEEQPIIDLNEGESARATSVAVGRWRIFRFIGTRPGIVTVSLHQLAGSFGLRMLVQREVLPTHESFLTFETTQGGASGVCSPTTAVGAAACRRCTHDFCICDRARGDVCTGKVHGNVLTEALSNDPLDGASASIQAPIYPREPFMIAVFSEFEVFAPYTFDVTVKQAIEDYDQNTPCSNLSAGNELSGRIRERERIVFQAPPIREGFDAEIRLDTPFTDTWGRCRWGGNDGTVCSYNSAPEVYTGRSDRPYDANCRGCYFDRGWKYPGTPLKVRYFWIKNITYGVPGQRCFGNGEWINRYNVTSKDTYPFYRTYTRFNTDPFAICDLKGTYPWTVPWPVDEMVEAIKVDSEEECCDKCAREPTCKFWTVSKNDACTQCDQQDVSYEDTYVRPAGQVTFIPGTKDTEWYESSDVIRMRGPTCYPVKMAKCCRLLSITESQMLQTKVPDANSVSGSSGRCEPATNGHVQLKAAQTLTCSRSSSSEVNQNLVADTAESVSREAYLDDRQLFYIPDERDNAPVCVQWWNGLSKVRLVDEDGEIEINDMPELTVNPRCVRYSSAVIKLRVKDELDADQCVVNVGTALPSYPQMSTCRDTVYRMGNGTDVDWKYYSVAFEGSGGFGIEWRYKDGRLVQGQSLGANQFIAGGVDGGMDGCLFSLGEDASLPVAVVQCADPILNLREKELQEWDATNSTSVAGQLTSKYSNKCLTTVMACKPSRREWVGMCSAPPSNLYLRPCSIVGFSATIAEVLQGDYLYKAGEPILLELTGILSSSYLLSYNLVLSPALITAEKDYRGVLVVGATLSSIKYRFLASPTQQATAGLQFYMVINQPIPVNHPLTIAYRHRPTSNLPRQRPPGWDDEVDFVSGPAHGPGADGVYVVPFVSAAGAGPFDFDISIAGNAELAGSEVPINVRVWNAENYLRSFKRAPITLQMLGISTAQQLDSSSIEMARANVVCATLTPGKAATCGPPREVRKRDADSTSQGWWSFFYLRVGEPMVATVQMADAPGRPMTSSNCSAHLFVQSAAGGALPNVTEILEQTRGVARLVVGAALAPSSSLVLSPEDGQELYIAARFPGIAPLDFVPSNTSNASYTCNGSLAYLGVRAAPVSWDEVISSEDIAAGDATNVTFAWASRRIFRISVEEAAFHIVSLRIFAGNAAMHLAPDAGPLPSRHNPPASSARRIETAAVGPAARAWDSVSGFSQAYDLPLLVVSPDDADFTLGTWVLVIFAEGPAALSLSLTRFAVPPTLQLYQEYSLTRPPAASFEWRVPYHPHAGLTISVSYTEVSGRSALDCPLSLLARYSLPPTRQSWLAAAGREGGRSTFAVPPRADQGVSYLVFSAARCPGGYTTNGTHCMRLDQCAAGAAHDFVDGGMLSGLRDGPCATATNATGQLVGASATRSPAVLAPPAITCSFRLRLETSLA